MSADQLFDWELPEKPTPKPKAEAETVPYDPAWKLLGKRSRVIGFHYPQMINADNAVVTMCGEVGRSVSVGDNLSRMVKCVACVEALDKHRREAQELPLHE